MEALTSSSLKFFADKNRYRALSSSRALFTRPEIRFFWSQKLNNVDLSQYGLRQFKAIESISSPSFSSETQADVENAEALTEAAYQSKTVHVEFQLHKECLFGQQFLLVGDDPIFGLWNPANAIPLDWSDGHIWIVELDIPIEKSIKFKFILKEATGEVVWQPGPDRILQTWETKSKIIISEDWENEEVQKMTEEDPMAKSTKNQTVDPNMELIVAENITCPEEEPMAYTNKESIVSDNITCTTEEPKANANQESIVTENKTYAKVESMANPKEEMIVGDNILGGSGIAVTDKKSMCTTDLDSLVNYERESVLVPGMTPLPTLTTGEALPKEVENRTVVDASTGADEAEDHNMPEKNEKQEPDRIVMMFNDGPEEEPEENILTKEQVRTDYKTADDDFLQTDIQWGRKTLRRLLMNLGFL